MTYSVPWWLAGEVDDAPRNPYSGQVGTVDIEATPLEAADFAEWEASLTELAGENAATPTVSPYPPEWMQPAQPVLDPASVASIPGPDVPTVYTGPGTTPTWPDVFNWYAQTTHAATPDVPVPQPIAGTQVRNAIDVANGQTIKAMSGFINQLKDAMVNMGAAIGQRITDVESVIGAITASQNATAAGQQNQLNVIQNNVLPQLWRAITKLNAAIPATADAVIKIMQKWATDNIHAPLEEQINTEKANRIAQVDQVEQGLAGRVHDIVNGMGLATAASVATIGTQVAKLTTEAEECTTPMCDTMGPNTNLGKLFKALSLASEAAFIAELLAMNEADLAAFLQTAFGKVAGVVNDFENTFQPGAETIGGFIKNTIGNVL